MADGMTEDQCGSLLLTFRRGIDQSSRVEELLDDLVSVGFDRDEALRSLLKAARDDVAPLNKTGP